MTGPGGTGQDAGGVCWGTTAAWGGGMGRDAVQFGGFGVVVRRGKMASEGGEKLGVALSGDGQRALIGLAPTPQKLVTAASLQFGRINNTKSGEDEENLRSEPYRLLGEGLGPWARMESSGHSVADTDTCCLWLLLRGRSPLHMTSATIECVFSNVHT